MPVGVWAPSGRWGAGRGACGIKRGPGWGSRSRRGLPGCRMCLGARGWAGVLKQSWLPASPPRRGSSLSLSAIQVFGRTPRCLHGPASSPSPLNSLRWWRRCSQGDFFKETFQELSACQRCITDFIFLFILSVGAFL